MKGFNLADLARLKITEGIITPAAIDVDDAGGDKIKNVDGKTFLLLENPGGDVAAVTITAQQTVRTTPGFGPMTKADLVINVNAGETKMVGPFPSAPWNDSAGDLVLTYSGAGAADINVSPLFI